MSKLIRFLPSLVFSAVLSVVATPLWAAAPTSLGKFGAWATYSVMDQGHTVCYMSITAKAPVPKIPSKKVKRGNVVLMITHRAAENSTDVVSYSAGTKFKPATDAHVTIGSKAFNLFTQDDTAWSRDPATDHALTLAIRGGANLAISGTAASGTPIADTVNLEKAEEAYQTISKTCGVPFEPLKKPPVASKPTPPPTSKATAAKAVAAPQKPSAPQKPTKPSVKK